MRGIHGMVTATATLLLLLAGCAETPKKAETREPAPPPEAIGGQKAFHQMYISARAWSSDAQGLRMTSIQLPEVKAAPGEAGAWQATFVSPSKQKAKTFTWSAIDAPGNLRQGTFPGPEEAYNPRQPGFPLAALKIDSTAAYKTAAGKSAEYMKKYPDRPINCLLALDDRTQMLAWRIVWGDSVGTSDHSVFVNATTGAYLETRH